MGHAAHEHVGTPEGGSADPFGAPSSSSAVAGRETEDRQVRATAGREEGVCRSETSAKGFHREVKQEANKGGNPANGEAPEAFEAAKVAEEDAAEAKTAEEEDEERPKVEEHAREEEEEKGPSRLKFPSYDDFLKEEEEERKAEEDAEAEEAKGDSANLDAAFELFMSEVKDLPAVTGKSTGHGKKETQAAMRKFKSSEEECLRLTCQTFSSPFQVLLLGAEATEDDVRKQYRKLSLLIHPDKCKHPMAQEAFQVVNKAYEQLQRAEMREKYRDVIEEAKRRVLKENAKENKKRRTQGIDVPLLSEDPAELQTEIMNMCEKMLEETKERREYAERTRQANERYEKEQLEKQAQEELDKCKERKEWLEKRDERVGAWRDYQSAIRAKDVKLQAFTGVRHQREQRKDDDVVKKKQRIQGIDTSYKDNWR
ncbi:DnaJ domain-containing protein [Besnoitia besnoiti]|uniref:DnaJ domain-containing protein n=1 Tax=Besnoitia besnoiti TaxID=94643 RepID=A0A2A9MHE1_BESBE|nr:DnaJ domain-containing protein [Besnoitia besnoiti]PFH34822.1 DnaJ domain-containing protein [Besnoitia besnoiti]